MKKIMLVARREFVATAGNKGFVIGLLIMPAVIVVAAIAGPRIMSSRSPQVQGEVAIIDPTGAIAPALRTAMSPQAIADRRAEGARRAMAQAGPAAEAVASEQAIERAIGQVPDLRLVERPAASDVQQEKQWLLGGGEQERHLALLVVRPDAVTRSEGQDAYGSYEIYVSRGLDDATETAIFESVRQALVDARLAAASLDRRTVEATMQVARPTSIVVGDGGDRPASRAFTRMLPFALGLLIFMGVIIGGQTLMTSTIEEKSSRVVEVLLAAVSPFELMAGKLLGQLGVGLLVIGLYVGLGMMALYSFAMLGLVDPVVVVYLFLFFLTTYLVFGALMMAIGAAVNQMAEAQSLMGPVMLVLMLPYMLSPMIGRAPNSTFSVAVSFIPPINTFAMMSRLASDAPPPAWQVWLTMAIGIAAAAAAIWFAAKIFRIGLLMHGKPPNFATLIRWARAA